MNSNKFFRFRIGHLFFILSLASVCLAWTYEESLSVALGALFAGASYCLIAVLLSVSVADFLERIAECWAVKSVRPLMGRYRWVIMDTVSVTLSICAIAVTNYILENSAFHAPKLLVFSGVASFVVAGLTFRRIFVGAREPVTNDF